MKKPNCEHPELKPIDENCSEELIKKCHGDQHAHHCDCEHPELKPNDGKCSDELIKQCHGDVK